MADRHRTLECSLCKKMMRSDSLKRHWISKHKTTDMELIIKVKSKTNIDGAPATGNDLKCQMIANDMLFDE